MNLAIDTRYFVRYYRGEIYIVPVNVKVATKRMFVMNMDDVLVKSFSGHEVRLATVLDYRTMFDINDPNFFAAYKHAYDEMRFRLQRERVDAMTKLAVIDEAIEEFDSVKYIRQEDTDGQARIDNRNGSGGDQDGPSADNPRVSGFAGTFIQPDTPTGREGR